MLAGFGSAAEVLLERQNAHSVANATCLFRDQAAVTKLAIEAAQSSNSSRAASQSATWRFRAFSSSPSACFGSRAYEVYSAKIAADAYEAGFKARLGLKDLRLAREAAGAAGRVLPLLDAAHGRMADVVEAGSGDLDWSAMAKFTIESAGYS